MDNQEQQNQGINGGVSPKPTRQEEKAARKERMRERRLQRRAKHNARIARGRLLKNLFIWFLGVIFLPVAIVGASFVVPISVITGNDGEIVSEEFSKRSVFEAVRYATSNSGELGFADLPIVAKTLNDLQSTVIGENEGGEEITLGDLVKIDTDKLNTIKFGSENLGDEIQSCVEVVATIESIGGAGALGDFGTLSVFTEESIAGTIADVDALSETADARKQYYYKPSEITVSGYAAAEETYKRAFKEDGTLVDELAALSVTDKGVIKLYYPPLEKVKFSELKDIIGDSIGRTTISSLLATFGASNETIENILGTDTTVSGLSDFDIKTVKLNVVLEEKEPTDDGYEENKKLWDVLKAATGVSGDADVTIGDLSDGFDMDNVKLNVVLEDNASNSKLYSILRDATGVAGDTDAEKNANITIGSLSGIDTDNIHLSSVLEPPDGEHPDRNKQLYNILRDATGVTGATDAEKNANITIGSLSGLDTDNIHLTSVLEDTAANAELYDILRDATGAATNADITIASLADIDTGDIKLTSVLPAPDGEHPDRNKQIYDILRDITGETENENIKVSSLGTIDVDSLHLTTVLADNAANAKLYSIMKDLTGAASNGAITVGDLSGIDTDDLHLTTVLEDNAANAKLYGILKDLTSAASNGAITVGDLSGIDTDDLHLTAVLEDTAANAKLYGILREITGVTGATDAEKNAKITVGSLGTINTNNIHLSTVLDLPTSDNGYANKKIYDILLDMTTATAYGDITIQHLGTINTNNIHLSTVLDVPTAGNSYANQKIYDILLDMTTATAYGDITIQHLGAINPDNLHLTTVIPSSDNKLLNPLLAQDPTIGNLGTTINNLEVSDIFAVECFTTDSSKTVDTNAKYTYNSATGKYALDAGGTYYISKDAKVWLFMFYNPTGSVVHAAGSTKGCQTEYTEKSVKFNDMETNMGSASTSFTTATVKQLIQTGILTEGTPGQYSNAYDLSFEDVLAFVH